MFTLSLKEYFYGIWMVLKGEKMVVCIAALIVFGFLSIFSAKYRPLAKEAFECVFKLIKLKPCDTKFDQKVKSKITAKLLRKNTTIARFTYKNFKVISLIFVILFFGSMFYSAYGVFNLVTYGTCDPHSDNCIFNPGVVGCGGTQCQEQCLCEQETCKAPEYKACEGNCDCQKQVCG